MRHEDLERRQVWVYVAAVALGVTVGRAAPGIAPVLEAALWPSLVLLLTASFTQVPLRDLPVAFRDGRFLGAVAVGNFLAVPLLVWALLALVPGDPAVRLGVLMVLLVPCTDWFIAFAQLGGGDERRAIAATPVNLLLQILLLPVYLWLFLGESFAGIMSPGRFAAVFLTLIVLPLAVAFLAQRRSSGRELIGRLGWLPVPLLALVVFLIAGAQADTVAASWPVLGALMPAFLLYLAGAVVLGMALGRVFALPAEQARTLVFSLATRNSFVVLPFALALPRPWDLAAVVIVFQSLVELFGMVAFVWLVPRVLRTNG